jgi:phosphate transport system permease protein
MGMRGSRGRREATAALAMRRPWRTGIAGDAIARVIAVGLGLSVLALAGLLIYELIGKSWQSITEFGLGFITSTTWDPVARKFGAAPAIYGTLISSLIALILAVPVSIGAAIFLAELAPSRLRNPLSFLVEMLAALPSVVLGIWGIYILVPWVRDAVEKSLGSHLSFIPLFDGPPFGFGMLAAGLILAIMVLPIITAISRDLMLAVPGSQREAMLALGATRWEVIFGAVLPYCRSGLVGAVILGLGRALGETMAVTMVIGRGYNITASLFQPASTAASTVASEFNEATYDLYISALVELALILLAITLLVNVVARLLVWRIARSPGVIRE